jgi:ADP-ribose pyrophosphatase YjhB (NUDIX family)
MRDHVEGDGPFLWLSASAAPPRGYRRLPEGGLCLSTFLFLRRGNDILLGKYADDQRLEELTGLDATRRRAHGRGYTIPATHVKHGEDPRDAARRLARDVLGIREPLALRQPTVETDYGEPARFPGMIHYDVWFFVEADVPDGFEVATPQWYAELAWKDPRVLAPSDYGRSHDEIVARWLVPRPATFDA